MEVNKKRYATIIVLFFVKSSLLSEILSVLTPTNPEVKIRILYAAFSHLP